jgi:hypothetical protein
MTNAIKVLLQMQNGFLQLESTLVTYLGEMFHSSVCNTNYCPIAVGVENPHNFWMCRQPRNVPQNSRQISITANIATYRRY